MSKMFSIKKQDSKMDLDCSSGDSLTSSGSRRMFGLKKQDSSIDMGSDGPKKGMLGSIKSQMSFRNMDEGSSPGKLFSKIAGGGMKKVLERDHSLVVSENLAGWLMKKSANALKRELEPRYFRIEGMSLAYYKSEDANARPQGSIDLNEVKWVRAAERSDDCVRFLVELGNRVYEMECLDHDEMKIWVESLELVRGVKASSKPSPNFSGYLKKKSKDVLQRQLQERFFRIEGNTIRYYKKETDTHEAGHIDLEIARWVRPYDTEDEDCRKFLIENDGRIYELEAADNFEMQLWIDSVEMVRALCYCAVPSTSLSGWLKKKSKDVLQRILQERFFRIEGQFIKYYKKESDNTQEQGSIDLSVARWVRPAKHSEDCKRFLIENDGRTFELEAADYVEMRLWVDSIQLVRAEVYQPKPSIDYSGWLMKKSKNKLKLALQERYFKIEGMYLRYYRDQEDEEEQGSIDLINTQVIRPYDSSAECKRFEIGQTDGRVFELEAGDNGEMKIWIESLEMVRTEAKERSEEEERQRIIALTPPRVLMFDEEGEEMYVRDVLNDLDRIYPEGTEGTMTVRQHIDCAEEAGAFLMELVKETDKCEIYKARYEIRAVALEIVNEALAVKMLPILQWGSPLLMDANLGDIHALIVWLTRFQETLRTVYCPVTRKQPEGIMGSGKNPFGGAQSQRSSNISGLSGADGSGNPFGDDESTTRNPFESDASGDNPFGEDESGSGGGNPFASDSSDAIGGAYGAEKGEKARNPFASGDSEDKARKPFFSEDAVESGKISGAYNMRESYFNRASLVVDSSKPTTYNTLFEALPYLCNLYVNGVPEKDKDGAVSHLIDSAMKVLETFLEKPGEMLQRHQDGSFFTNVPTDVWQNMHQHLDLAASTRSPVLHVMIADKISAAINSLINLITDYVNNLDTSENSELKEIELELLSALANDNANHIEEIMVVINEFEMDEIRQKVDEIYDSVTLKLVECGQCCLKKLSDLVMNDLEEHMDQVFMEDWLEGEQMKIAIATLEDYLQDMNQYLMPFWSQKIVDTMLEAIVLRYTSSILFKVPMNVLRDRAIAAAQPEPEPEPVEDKSVMSSLWGFGKKMFKQAATTTVAAVAAVATKKDEYPEILPVDPESLGRVAQDVNALYAFFYRRVKDEEKAKEYLEIINEVSLMMQLPVDDLGAHIINRIGGYPSSAKAIYEASMACAWLVPGFTPDEVDQMAAEIKPFLDLAPSFAKSNDENNIMEGHLGLLYLDIVPQKEEIHGDLGNSWQLAENYKRLMGVPLAELRKNVRKSLGEGLESIDRMSSSSSLATNDINNMTEEQRIKWRQSRRKSVLMKSNTGLVDDVLTAISHQDDAIQALNAEREAEEKAEEERLAAEKKLKDGIINMEGFLDKKGSSHTMWQQRWFKIVTRQNMNPDADSDCPFIYSLMWYKKQGGAVVKALYMDQIRAITIIDCNRKLAFNKTKDLLMLEIEVDAGDKYSVVEFEKAEMSRKDKFFEKALDKFGAHLYFSLVLVDEAHVVLRTTKVDKLISWVNALTRAGGMAYDAENREFNKEARES